MTFFHGTSYENWEKIKQEGVLYGRRYVTEGSQVKEVDRCTYLATDIDEAKCYGNIVLRVEYDPFKHKRRNNYIDGCWQIRVYEPIPISNVTQIMED